jgi:hypothetical protein
MFFAGCSSDEESAPLSFIDGYSVNLTEPEGTTYTGDFFPIEEGYTCNYTGSVDMLTRITIPGYDPIEEPTIAPSMGMLKVLALRDIPLGGGLVALYPIVDLTEMQGEVVSDTSRFFDKDAEAVYVRAIKMSDGSYLEVEDPVFIKSSLVVGESWNTAPKMDMTDLLAGELEEGIIVSNMNLNAKSRFFVVGHESISLPIGTRWAMRLEQASDITMTGTIFSEGISIAMTVTAKLANIYHMIADTGIVHQNTTGPLNMKMTAEGQTFTISITINKSELFLVSLGDGYYKNYPSGLNRSIFATKRPSSFDTPVEQKIWKVSQKLVHVFSKQLSF